MEGEDPFTRVVVHSHWCVAEWTSNFTAFLEREFFLYIIKLYLNIMDGNTKLDFYFQFILNSRTNFKLIVSIRGPNTSKL